MLLGRGARPQLIKPAALSRVLRRSDRELLLHTGSIMTTRYPVSSSNGLEMPAPGVNLTYAALTYASQMLLPLS